jgi:hypothetical protein
MLLPHVDVIKKNKPALVMEMWGIRVAVTKKSRRVCAMGM